MTGFIQSIITIVLFILILGGLVVIHELGHFVTARLAKVRVLEFGIGFPPRAKVLRSKRRDALHAQLAADRRLRQARGRGRQRRRRPALVRRPALPHQDAHPRRRRGDEHRARLRDLHRRSRGSRRRSSACGSSRSSRARRRPRPGSRPGDAIVAVDGERYQFIAGTDRPDRPPRPRRRDRRPDHRRQRRSPRATSP